MAGYSRTPLAKKLGIKEGAKVVLLGAPERFAATLAPLPSGVVTLDALPKSGTFQIAVLFAETKKELANSLKKAKSKMAPSAGI
ncbi:MAG TPA: hypothetical protein VF407_20105, partial [Polyangiaceae bacterium]